MQVIFKVPTSKSVQTFKGPDVPENVVRTLYGVGESVIFDDVPYPITKCEIDTTNKRAVVEFSQP